MDATGRDPFGKTGDFITGPEISQVFGELVGLWVLTEWMAQGRKTAGVQLMEFGPGRGTLMDDMLRTLQSFQPFVQSLDTIYLIEASPMLREKQHKLLCGTESLVRIENGFESRIKYPSKNKIVWYEDMRFIPSSQENHSPFIIAHEFFDALPIHIFQSVPQAFKPRMTITTSTTAPPPRRQPQQNEWRELVVSVSAPDPNTILEPASPRKDMPEFELSISKAATAHSASLPTISSRYKSILPISHSTIEISPLSLALTSQIATLIGGSNKSSRGSGAALVVDYGSASTVPTHSLRGIRSHEIVSPLSAPGKVDISASVDFTALAHAALDASPKVEVHGPTTQSAWLKAMGGATRVEALTKQQEGENKSRIEGAWKRLVDQGPKGMGGLYHVMAIVPEGRMEQGGVVGFGGDVVD